MEKKTGRRWAPPLDHFPPTRVTVPSLIVTFLKPTGGLGRSLPAAGGGKKRERLPVTPIVRFREQKPRLTGKQQPRGWKTSWSGAPPHPQRRQTVRTRTIRYLVGNHHRGSFFKKNVVKIRVDRLGRPPSVTSRHRGGAFLRSVGI